LGSPLRPQWLLGLAKNHGVRSIQLDALAARYISLETLALSPQCGFASGSAGSLIAVDDERRKLELVASTLPGSGDN
jgi:hypothetical protein